MEATPTAEGLLRNFLFQTQSADVLAQPAPEIWVNVFAFSLGHAREVRATSPFRLPTKRLLHINLLFIHLPSKHLLCKHIQCKHLQHGAGSAVHVANQRRQDVVRPELTRGIALTEVNSASGGLAVIERASSTRPRATVSAEQSALFSKYPLFFRAVAAADAHPSNLGSFGIQCGAGWYPLIEEAATQIEHELRQMSSNQLVHWENIAALEHAMLMEKTGSVYPVLPVCTDIRQVNGALVIVVVQGFVSDSEQWQRLVCIALAVKEKSRSVCESCGNPGKMRKTYWRHVYCENCIAPIGVLDEKDL